MISGNFKKILAGVLSAVMCFTILAGCGDKKEDTATTETTVASVENAEGDTSAPSFVSGDAKVTVEGNKFMVNGKELWINGVNTPWDNWNDFGSSNFDEEFWDSHFEQLAKGGVNASRVWINCSSMMGVRLKTTGTVKEVTEKHWQDLDKLFEIAEKHGIYIMATMISFDHFKDSNGGYENWRNMITTDEGIDSFVNDYIVEFAKRYDGCDYLWSIDLCNEPDWIKENAECGQIGFENLSNYFAKAAAAIHENSDILVTVGMGMVRYNSDSYDGNYISDDFLKSLSGNENSYIDFYSTHWYYWQKQWMGYPFTQSPADFGLDDTKPCLIGETSADASENGCTLTDEYENAYNNNWQGVMAWTSNEIDGCGGWEYIEPAAARILELAPEKVHPLE